MSRSWFPRGRVTDARTVRLVLLSERVTKAPALGAPPLSVTVQVEEPGVVIVVGLHDTEVREMGGGVIVAAAIVPPVPVRVRAVPVGSTADVLVTVTAVLVTVEAIVTLMTATTPLAIVLAFIPVARQV